LHIRSIVGLGDALRRPVVFFLALLFAVSTTRAAEPRNFALGNELPVWDVAAEDLNGDDAKDLVLLGCDENSYPLEKSAALFIANGGGKYADKPDHVLKLAPETAAIFFAEVDGAAPREPVALSFILCIRQVQRTPSCSDGAPKIWMGTAWMSGWSRYRRGMRSGMLTK